jgi:hypothetical protein
MRNVLTAPLSDPDDIPEICPHCDATVANAIHAFRKELSGHSLTSTQKSIWPLLRKHLDGPVENLCANFRPSRPHVLNIPGLFKPHGFAAMVQQHDHFFEFVGLAQTQVSGSLPADEKFDAMNRTCASADRIYVNTLETLMGLAHFCWGQHPKQGQSGSRGLTGRERIHLDSRAAKGKRSWGGTYHQFCDMCWRPREAATAADPSSTPPRRGSSTRFCSVHAPGRHGSLYCTDLNYVEQFQRELSAYLDGTSASQLVRLGIPSIREDQDTARAIACSLRPTTLGKHYCHDFDNEAAARLLAYTITRANLSKRQEEILCRTRNGQTQSQIALELGFKHRQAVSLALQRMPPWLTCILAITQSDTKRRHVCPDMSDPKCLEGRAGNPFFQVGGPKQFVFEGADLVRLWQAIDLTKPVKR